MASQEMGVFGNIRLQLSRATPLGRTWLSSSLHIAVLSLRPGPTAFKVTFEALHDLAPATNFCSYPSFSTSHFSNEPYLRQQTKTLLKMKGNVISNYTGMSSLNVTYWRQVRIYLWSPTFPFIYQPLLMLYPLPRINFLSSLT